MPRVRRTSVPLNQLGPTAARDVRPEPSLGITRRSLLGASLGIGTSLFFGASRAAASPSPRLPGEYSRNAGLVSRYGGTVFDSIGVRINGDAARIFIPQTVKPGSRVPVVWLYHAAESSQDALLGGFRGIGEKAVDRGAIAICQNAGGTLYSHPTAQQHQRNGFAYLSSLYSVSGSYLRATSGGGALACETYGAQLIPGILGLYLVNGVYDLRKLYALGGRQMLSVGRAFGFSTGQIDRANPARHPTIAWTRTASRVAVSSPSSTDTSVPPRDHGLALAAKAGPVAIEASVRTHGLGHTTPAWADTDFLAAMDRWVPTTPSA